MPMIDVLHESKKEKIMRDTWGHLAATPRESYRGFVLFSVSPNGDHNLLDFDFSGLDGNPWTLDHVSAWWSRESSKSRYSADGEVRFWRWEGTYTALKNGSARLSGKAVEMLLTPRSPKHAS